MLALTLLVFATQAPAGPNANAVLSLDLIADGGAGNQIDDGVTSGTVSGQGTKITVEVFATGVTTSLAGVRVEFDFDASVLTYVRAENSVFLFTIPHGAIGTNLAPITPVTLPSSGFLARAEFTTTVDVMGREFSIGIKKVILAESGASGDEITTTEVIRFNAAPSPDFNNDGIVNLLDYSLFVAQWNTREGGPNWDAKFDLHGDGVINLLDYGIFVSNWNKTFPVTPSDRGDDEEMVSIPDMNLRTVVEDSLGKASGAPISRDEMATLTRFFAVNANISDLTGLEFATNLSLLYLDNNSISDLTPLSGLTNLQGLFLQNNSIVDISPLVANMGLSSGNQIDVRNNPLSTTSIDTHIPTLHSRGVEVLFTIEDPTPVSIPDANLRAEIEDALDKASGETITRGDMSNLISVSAGSASISDLTGLEFATNLDNLYLYNNTISDVSALSGLTNLTRLTLLLNLITDISPLSGLTNLSLLRLSFNAISDVSALSGLTNLTSLSLVGNRISDLSPLVANTGLGSGDEVDMRNNPLSTTSIDTHIPALQGRGVTVQF